jgi:archaetidylinositol phosphate synthase
VLDRYRGSAQDAFTPFAEAVAAVGLTPNAVTGLALAAALAAGAVLAASGPAAPASLLVAGAALVFLNAFLDGLDGHLARIQGTDSDRGDYADHAVDRFADAAILVGLVLSGWTVPLWGVPADAIGVLAVAGVLLTSYMGTQAQAVGVGRDYSGILARADRMSLLFLVPVTQYLVVSLGVSLPLGVPNLMVLLLAWFALAGNLTALQRFVQGWRALGP